MSRAVSSLTRRQSGYRHRQQRRFPLDGGVDGQSDEEHEEGLGVELFEVAVLQGRVQEERGGESRSHDAAARPLASQQIDGDGGGGDQAGLEHERVWARGHNQ